MLKKNVKWGERGGERGREGRDTVTQRHSDTVTQWEKSEKKERDKE